MEKEKNNEMNRNILEMIKKPSRLEQTLDYIKTIERSRPLTKQERKRKEKIVEKISKRLNRKRFM